MLGVSATAVWLGRWGSLEEEGRGTCRGAGQLSLYTRTSEIPITLNKKSARVRDAGVKVDGRMRCS